MATTKGKQAKPKKAEWKGFYNIALSKEDEAAFLAWDCGLIDVYAWISHLTDSGYKVSFDFDPYNQGARASLYCTNAKMEWAGYTLTAWAEDTQTAFKLLLFKHDVMCKGKWEVAKDITSRGTSNFG